MEVEGDITTLIAPSGRGNTLSINQDMSLHMITLAPGEGLSIPVGARRLPAWY